MKSLKQYLPENWAMNEVSADDDEGMMDAEADEAVMAELQALPQPIGVNGGSYLYRVDLTKQPLVWTASDGSVLNNARTLRSIGDWMDDPEGWFDVLDGNYDVQDAIRDGVLRLPKKRTTPWSDQEGHELANMRGESVEDIKRLSGILK